MSNGSLPPLWGTGAAIPPITTPTERSPIIEREREKAACPVRVRCLDCGLFVKRRQGMLGGHEQLVRNGRGVAVVRLSNIGAHWPPDAAGQFCQQE